MEILAWVLFGFVVGLIARAVMPGRDPLGLIGTTILGIVGALLGGWIARAIGWGDATAGFESYIAATLGAVILLAAYRMFFARSRTSHKVSDKTDRWAA